MANLPFAFFNLGAQEMVILLLLAVAGVFTVGMGVLIAFLIRRSSRNDDDRDD
jgi:hypothetical protein